MIDLLRPLIPQNKLTSEGIDDCLVCFTQSPEECDYFILPMAWNYYLENYKYRDAHEFIQLGEQKNKKIIICVKGDYYYKLPKSDNIISFYYSAFKSKAGKNTFALPVIIRDPHDTRNTKSYRSYKEYPDVGFCGQVDSNIGKSFIKSLSLAFARFTRLTLNKSNIPDSIIPPTYIRKRILDEVESSNLINTNFIKNSRYKGGSKNDVEKQSKLWDQFKNNITGNDYTLCIRGTGNFSARFYETLALGRIPVFVNTDCMLPFEDEINWENHIIQADYKRLESLNDTILEFHEKLNEETFDSVQKKNRLLWEKYFKFSGFYTQFVSLLERLNQK